MVDPSFTDRPVRLRSPRSIHLQMLLLERRAAASRDRVHPPVLGGNDPTLRDLLFRAGAAWLIGWATLLSALQWARL
jgi:hypothetical protein